MAQAVGLAAGGSLISTIGNLIKTKVKAPDFVPINAAEEAAKAIGANLGNLPAAGQLASQTNALNQKELLSMIRSVVPNFDKLSSDISNNIGEQVHGRLPTDVINQIYRASGAQGVASGTGGSQFAGNLTARDLGLNSLQLMNQGFSNANAWLANTRQNLTAPLFDPSSMFISPAQQIAVTAENNANQYNNQWLKNQLKAAQSTASIVGSGLDQFGKSLGSIGSIGGTGSAPSSGGGVSGFSATPANFGSSGFGNYGVSYSGG